MRSKRHRRRSPIRLTATISVSRQNDHFAEFQALGPALHVVDMFGGNVGALTQCWRFPGLRRALVERVRRDRTELVIDLMPHVWSSFITPALQAANVRYAPIVHDADPHPGDYRTGLIKSVLDRSVRQADHVLTLSDTITQRLIRTGRVPPEKLSTLFLPDYGVATVQERPVRAADAPLRLLFMGRIMRYKGLELFLDAVDLLRAEGLPVQVGVFGEGPLGANAERLSAMGAEVVNRWLTDAEMAAVYPRYDAMVLSHIEASQSGIAAMALGAGLPSVATPVGGLPTQIEDGQTGVMAAEVNALAFAEAAKRLLRDPALYQRVCETIRATQAERSMARFIEACVQEGSSGGRHTTEQPPVNAGRSQSCP